MPSGGAFGGERSVSGLVARGARRRLWRPSAARPGTKLCCLPAEGCARESGVRRARPGARLGGVRLLSSGRRASKTNFARAWGYLRALVQSLRC